MSCLEKNRAFNTPFNNIGVGKRYANLSQRKFAVETRS